MTKPAHLARLFDALDLPAEPRPAEAAPEEAFAASRGAVSALAAR